MRENIWDSQESKAEAGGRRLPGHGGEGGPGPWIRCAARRGPEHVALMDTIRFPRPPRIPPSSCSEAGSRGSALRRGRSDSVQQQHLLICTETRRGTLHVPNRPDDGCCRGGVGFSRTCHPFQPVRGHFSGTTVLATLRDTGRR